MSFLLFMQIVVLIIVFTALQTLAAIKLFQIFWNIPVEQRKAWLDSLYDGDDLDTHYEQNPGVTPVGANPFVQ